MWVVARLLIRYAARDGTAARSNHVKRNIDDQIFLPTHHAPTTHFNQ